jgi:hypothetical protein
MSFFFVGAKELALGFAFQYKFGNQLVFKLIPLDNPRGAPQNVLENIKDLTYNGLHFIFGLHFLQL